MAVESGQTLRDSLRQETADAHSRVDALFGSSDLGTDAGYSDFLRAQAIAWETLRPILDVGSLARADALRHDLAVLGIDRPSPLADPDLPGEASIGHRYVLEGSRLGSSVLLRELQKRSPRLAECAGAYLEQSIDVMAWKQLSTRLQMDAEGCANRRALIDDALFMFELFERSWRAADIVPADIS